MNEHERDFDTLDLEEILKEFGSDTEQTLTAGEEDVSHRIGDLDTLLAAAEETPVQPDDAPETVPTEPEAEPAAQPEAEPEEESEEEAEEAPEQMPDLFSLEELEAATDPNALKDIGEEAPQEEPQAVTSDTIRLDDLSEIVNQTPEQESVTDATIRITPIEVDAPEIPQEPEAAPETPIAPEPIPFRPRQRLRELKRDLIAGPEKRYYDLTEIGVGKLQMAMFLALIVVLVSAGAGIMYAAGYVPENRMKLMIYAQILAMLIGALLGSQQMIEGVSDLFHGKFTLNTLLTVTFLACCVDSYFCLKELRVPLCAAFTLQVLMSLWSVCQQRTTEMGMMDTLRKAVRLNGVVKCEDYFEGRPGYQRREGRVSDFMDHYSETSGPEKVMNLYALVCLVMSLIVAVAASLLHDLSMGALVFSTALLVGVPASSFICLSRPMAVLERRLHRLGTVLCGWRGIKGLSKKAAFPLYDEDMFPAGCAKMNGVKFFNDRNPDQVIAYAAAMMRVCGGTLAPIFDELLTSRAGIRYTPVNMQYFSGGIGGDVAGQPVLMGTLDFLQQMGIQIPEGMEVRQAVYVSISGELAGLFAITYNRTKFSAQGIGTLCSYRTIRTVILARDFMVTAPFMKEKFGANSRRLAFPTRQERNALAAKTADAEAPALALTTQEGLISSAYAVTGARALRKAWRLGMAIHMLGGILGILIMAALAVLGSTHLLSPVHILLYQLIWMIPGLLVTLWPRTA